MHLLSSIIVICVYRYIVSWGLSRGSDGKESACNVPDVGSIPGSGKSPGEGNGYPLQYSCYNFHGKNILITEFQCIYLVA